MKKRPMKRKPTPAEKPDSEKLIKLLKRVLKEAVMRAELEMEIRVTIEGIEQKPVN